MLLLNKLGEPCVPLGVKLREWRACARLDSDSLFVVATIALGAKGTSENSCEWGTCHHPIWGWYAVLWEMPDFGIRERASLPLVVEARPS